MTQQLWVFGDSYADTGNLGDLGRELTHAWYDPYGATFPGRPTGRFSDGRVLTDFIGTSQFIRSHLNLIELPAAIQFIAVGNNRSNYICTWDGMGRPAGGA